MGKLSHEPYIHHFSHPHPLELTNVAQSQSMNLSITICSCCTLRSDGGYMYTCRTCSVGGGSGFALHLACAQMPALITHPSHPKHPLSLLPATPYHGGSSFNCDACSCPGTAFCYHCPDCDFDLHPTCAYKPLSTAHPRHHHQLSLEFFPPYSIRAFSCDVCGGTGKNHWLYRCTSCEFDAHLECATSTAGGRPIGQAPAPLLQQQPQPQPQPRPALQHYPSYPGSYNNNNVVQPPQPQPQQYQVQHQNSAPGNLQNYQYQPQQITTSPYYNIPPASGPTIMAPAQQIYRQPQPQPQPAGAGSGGQQGNNNDLTNMMAQSFLDAAAQQAGQTLVQNLMGGGDNNGGTGNDGGGNDCGGGGGDDPSGGSSVLGNVLGAVFGGGGGSGGSDD
ncbi:hypothetical protein CRG98_026119 [Punica granatum]|uniref:DC1 domain-containing protein n=1 Tax=Punica granatum TaxID=22663 RepID=A0A2I0JB12_PUNGR|nr:hypothetical protein CRG98_026119 [Punica granatum]